MSEPVKCKECGHEMQVGQWPHCPHEWFKQSKIFTPYFDVQLDSTPVYIESARQLDKEVKKRNLNIRNSEHLDDINHRRDRLGMPPTRI